MALPNPFTTREPQTDPMRADMQISVAPEYVIPQSGAYGVPPIKAGAPYISEFGYAPELRTSAQETPSAQRLKTIPRMDYRPNPVRPPDEWWDRIDRDKEQRHSVEDQDADGWTERKGVAPTDRRWAPNPRSTPPAESRPTMRMAPRTYSFTRPFDQHSARQFNGNHFSMADHRRNYEILGMAPVRTMRNTYRLEPVPWDMDIVDLPPTTDGPVEARLRGVNVPSPSRSWRL